MDVLKLMFMVWSFDLSFVKTGSAITITKSPNRDVVLTSQNPAGTSFLCQLPSSPTISTIYAMNIVRKRHSDSDFSAIASVTLSDPQNPTIPTSASDVSSRATVSLGIDTNTPTSSQLKLDFVTQQIVCTDEGEYKCTVTYPNANGTPVTDEDNTTLRVYALPYDISLVAKDSNGFTIVGTPSNPKEMNVGDEVSFSCSAEIGSDNSTKLRWKITSQTSPSYIPHNPTVGTYSDGTATGPSDCIYFRTATLNYTISPADAYRLYGLAFQCYILVQAPTGTYSVPNPPTFHITAIADSTTQSTTGFSSTTPERNATTPICSAETTDDNRSKIIIGVVSGLVTGMLCFISGMIIGVICQRRTDKTRASKQGSDYLVPTSPSGVSPATPSYVNSDFRVTGNNRTVATNTPNQENGPYMDLQLELRGGSDNYESLTSH